MNGLEKLIDFLEELDNSKIYYKLNKIRDSILVEVVVPDERWEIEFMRDGEIVIEKFKSDLNIYDEKELKNLLENFKD